MMWSCIPSAKPQIKRINLCQLPSTAYSTHSYLPAVSGGHLLHSDLETRLDKVEGFHLFLSFDTSTIGRMKFRYWNLHFVHYATERVKNNIKMPLRLDKKMRSPFTRNMWSSLYDCLKQWAFNVPYESVSKSFRTESITTLTTTINIRWEAIQRIMAAKLTRQTHKIEIQLHLVAFLAPDSQSGNFWIHPWIFYTHTRTRLSLYSYNGLSFTPISRNAVQIII